jgi:hypothetical protein
MESNTDNLGLCLLPYSLLSPEKGFFTDMVRSARSMKTDELDIQYINRTFFHKQILLTKTVFKKIFIQNCLFTGTVI